MVFLSLVLAHLPMAHATLPLDDASWLPLQRLGEPFGDSAEDAVDSRLNLVGETDNPVGQWWIDSTSLYVRIRLERSPESVTVAGTLEGGFGTYGWGVLVDTDGDPTGYEHLVAIDESGTRLGIWGAADGPGWSTEPSDLSEEETTPLGTGMALVTTAETEFGSFDNAYLDLKIPRDWIGLSTPSSRAHIALVTDLNRSSRGFEYDIAAPVGGDELASALSDPIGEDGDADGLTLTEELAWGTDPQEADTDGDGYSDGDELAMGWDPCDVLDPGELPDTDCDGVVDPLDPETVFATEDVDGDGIPNDDEAACGGDPCVAEDDIDGDGLSTLDEISDGTDPCIPEGSGDTADATDTGMSTDTGDATDTAEGADTGGAPGVDTDEDCDGIVDVIDDEIAFTAGADNDGDGLPNELEIDVCGTDPCVYDIDPDLDGLNNRHELACEANPCSPDSDADGRWDNEEMSEEDCGPDTDGDGVADVLDPDAPVSTDPLEPESGKSGFVGGQFTGGGCTHVPLSTSLIWVGLLAALCTRRRMAGMGALTLLVLPLDAVAQSVDSNRFQPSPQARHFVGLEDPARSETGMTAALFVHHARDPLLYRVDDPTRNDIRVVGTLWSTDLIGGYRFGLWDVALHLPSHVYAAGDAFEQFGVLGDVALQAGTTLIDRNNAPVGLGLSTRVSAPTGDQTHWLSTNTPTATSYAHVATGDRIVVAAQMGFTIAESQSLGDLTTGSQARWAVGTHLPLTERGSLSVEMDGSHYIHALNNPGAHPIELRGFGRWALAEHWLLTMGTSTALSRGIGAPVMRVIGGIGFVPKSHRVAAPNEPIVTKSTALHISITDPQGDPVETTAHLIEADLSVATNVDGIASFSVNTGTHSLRISTPGFAPIQRILTLSGDRSINVDVVLSPSRVALTGNQIQIQDKIYFETGSAEIRATSHSLLDEVALVMLDNPQLLNVEVQGHTDDVGSTHDNQELSSGRAQSVRSYLIEAGVRAERLQARGFGESMPLTTADTAEGRTQNRRVEFHLIDHREP